jgi:microcystin-dependent protein
MSFWKWSRTASSNASADASINWAEGQAPSSVNDSARAMMAAAAKYRDDIAGAILTGGTSTAYTVASYQVFDTLAHLEGQMIAFTPHATNAAVVTLNVDGLGAKPLRTAPAAELAAGVLIQGTPYVATYSNADGAFYLRDFYGNPYNVPLGGMLEYTGTTAPNSAFVLPYGQAISRTTYAAYFALVGTTYGAGDGSTTFNVIDKRGRVSAGKDDMGGSAAGRLTSGGSGVAGTTLGATGGAEAVTLSVAQLPVIAPAGSVSAPVITTKLRSGSAPNAGAWNIALDGGGEVGTNTTIAAASAPTFTGTPFGSGNSHSNVQPTIMVNYVLRVL